LADVCGDMLIDLHSDPGYHRSVFTLAGPDDDVAAAAMSLAREAVAILDLGAHTGVHPRFGVVDVVPFIPLVKASGRELLGRENVVPLRAPVDRFAMTPDLGPAVDARDRFAKWAGSELGVPCFLYGPLPRSEHRTLPTLRRDAFVDLSPDTGPDHIHPSAGACAVGARHFLVAYNLQIAGATGELVRSVAGKIRGPAVRSLGFTGPDGWAHVSCNLVDPLTIGPGDVHDQVTALLAPHGAVIERCELVGLLPAAVLESVPRHRWEELGIGPEATIESRLAERGSRRA
jgi:glutamate formiminotransferase